MAGAVIFPHEQLERPVTGDDIEIAVAIDVECDQSHEVVIALERRGRQTVQRRAQCWDGRSGSIASGGRSVMTCAAEPRGSYQRRADARKELSATGETDEAAHLRIVPAFVIHTNMKQTTTRLRFLDVRS